MGPACDAARVTVDWPVWAAGGWLRPVLLSPRILPGLGAHRASGNVYLAPVLLNRIIPVVRGIRIEQQTSACATLSLSLRGGHRRLANCMWREVHAAERVRRVLLSSDGGGTHAYVWAAPAYSQDWLSDMLRAATGMNADESAGTPSFPLDDLKVNLPWGAPLVLV